MPIHLPPPLPFNVPSNKKSVSQPIVSVGPKQPFVSVHQAETQSSAHAGTTRLEQQRQTQREPAPVKPVAEKKNPYAIAVKTGATFHRKGFGGFDKMMAKKVRAGRDTFSNLTKPDQKFIDNLIAKHAHALPTGSNSIPLRIRVNMKHDVEAARRAGTISKADADDFKRMIDSTAPKPS